MTGCDSPNTPGGSYDVWGVGLHTQSNHIGSCMWGISQCIIEPPRDITTGVEAGPYGGGDRLGGIALWDGYVWWIKLSFLHRGV